MANGSSPVLFLPVSKLAGKGVVGLWLWLARLSGAVGFRAFYGVPSTLPPFLLSPSFRPNL